MTGQIACRNISPNSRGRTLAGMEVSPKALNTPCAPLHVLLSPANQSPVK